MVLYLCFNCKSKNIKDLNETDNTGTCRDCGYSGELLIHYFYSVNEKIEKPVDSLQQFKDNHPEIIHIGKINGNPCNITLTRALTEEEKTWLENVIGRTLFEW